ncbi:uncharacterized protein LOC118733944 [Rhagoletis pomonella]|uniref:uncharacterized protein LOC118733944 n=1 Tax=Rhagoletis pomonella TaxID=28610 RepID=UPI001780C45F|nr:uncharacterized protein LOC118733944 [Rhagoletis pomonella]
MELRPIIDAAPSTGKYQYIRTKLTEYLTESQQCHLHRVVREMPLGDRRPSDLFNEMKRAAGSALSGSILHDLWVNRLPAYAKAAIIATSVPITKKLKITDFIVESIQLREGRVNEVCGIQNNSDSDLRVEIAALTQCIDKALDNGKTHRRSRSKTPARNRISDSSSDEVCWYHAKFGQKATRCRPPCTFARSPSTNVSQ